MNRTRLSAPALAIGAALLASGLAGCSADRTSSESPSSSRMVRPSEIPDVSVSSSDDVNGLSTATATETATVNMPEQIWVRSASYAKKEYHLTLATAPAGKFFIYDAQPAGGTHNGPTASGDCTVSSEKPLDTRPHGAISAVSHLVTLDCQTAAPMNMPVVEGTWTDANKAGSSDAIFRLGGTDHQGRPALPSDPPDNPDTKIDATVVSVKHLGDNLTVRVWATEYVSLGVSKEDGSDATLIDCTTKMLPATKPGIKTAARQRLFEVSCGKIPSLKGYALSTTYLFGSAGRAPAFSSSPIELAPGAKIVS